MFSQENEQGWIISAVVVPNFFRGRKFEGKQTFLVVAVIFYLLIVARCSRIGTFFVCLFVLAFRAAKGFARNLSREGRTLRSNSFLKQILVWFSFLYKSVTARNGFLRWWFFFFSGLRACTEAVQNFSNTLTTVWSHGPDSKSMDWLHLFLSFSLYPEERERSILTTLLWHRYITSLIFELLLGFCRKFYYSFAAAILMCFTCSCKHWPSHFYQILIKLFSTVHQTLIQTLVFIEPLVGAFFLLI